MPSLRAAPGPLFIADLWGHPAQYLGLCFPGGPGEWGLCTHPADCRVWEPGALYFPISPYFPSPERSGGKFQNAGLAQMALLAACPSRGSA